MYKFPTPQDVQDRTITVRRPRPKLDELLASIDRIGRES